MAIKAYLIFTAPYFLLAFMQSPITPFNEFSFQIWSLFYESQLLVENWYAEFLYKDYNRFHFLVRVIGPYGSPTALCYALIPPIIFSAFLYLQEKKIKYYVWFIFLSSVAFLTLTRSLLLGTVLMILYLAFMQIYLRRDRWVVISQSIIVLATIPFLLTEFSELADFGFSDFCSSSCADLFNSFDSNSNKESSREGLSTFKRRWRITELSYFNFDSISIAASDGPSI